MLEVSDENDDDVEHETHPDDSRIIGGDQFVQQIPFITYRPRSPLTLEQLAHKLCQQHNISVDILCSPSRARNLTPLRLEFTRQAIEQRIGTSTQIAHFLHRDPSTLTKLLERHSIKPSKFT